MCELQLTEEVCNLKSMHLKVDVVEKYWTRSTELTKVMFSSSGKKNELQRNELQQCGN